MQKPLYTSSLVPGGRKGICMPRAFPMSCIMHDCGIILSKWVSYTLKILLIQRKSCFQPQKNENQLEERGNIKWRTEQYSLFVCAQLQHRWSKDCCICGCSSYPVMSFGKVYTRMRPNPSIDWCVSFFTRQMVCEVFFVFHNYIFPTKSKWVILGPGFYKIQEKKQLVTPVLLLLTGQWVMWLVFPQGCSHYHL